MTIQPRLQGLPADLCKKIPFHALRQGGPDSMDVWNATMHAIMHKLHQLWTDTNMGIILDPGKNIWTHLVWVDGITLMARRQEHIELMANQLTEELHAWGLQ